MDLKSYIEYLAQGRAGLVVWKREILLAYKLLIFPITDGKFVIIYQKRERAGGKQTLLSINTNMRIIKLY